MVRARPMRSPSTPKASPPVAQPIINTLVVMVLHWVGSRPVPANNSFIAGIRARMNNC